MAILCEKCGRQYDVTLFQFGRTINCTCGTRVGFEHKINLTDVSEIKFFADVNVARLVRWLRAIGVDTEWEDAIADHDLIKRAIEENRIVLTLDKKLTREWRADNVLLLQSDKFVEQFEQVVKQFHLKLPPELFIRCLVCNTLLRLASETEILEQAPPRARENHDTFHVCPKCEKIYWKGSHTRRMRVAIEAAFSRICQ